MEPTTQTDPVQTTQPTNTSASPTPKQKTLFLSFAGFIALAALALIGGMLWSNRSTVSASDLVQVGITPKGFGPTTIHIQAGQSVTWVNADSAPHEVIADSKTSKGDTSAFDSKALGNHETYTVTFDKAGIYTYYDAMNPYTNKGQVTVN